MSPSSPRPARLSSSFEARMGAWIQSILLRRDSASDGDEGAQCRYVTTRASFDAAVQAEIEQSRPQGVDLAVAMFDIDHLGSVNEDHGFDIGDVLIAQVQTELLADLRPQDVLLPLGCGAWVLLFPGIPAIDAHDHVESLRDFIERRLAIHFATHQIGGLTVATISAGVIASEAAALDLPDLLQSASQATLASKLQGGNRTSTWSETTKDVVGRTAGRRRAQRDAQLSTVLSLAEALDLRDTDTSNHSNMVARYSELMARELGLPEDHVKRVRIAGLLHDIGKIGVPDSVLRKPAKLDDDEWAMMQAHPNIGARLLASIDAEDIRSWVLAHHERPDGHGYPLGLKGDEIPIEAKILSVADAYEAMTVDRVYRPAPGPEIARAELDRLRGLQFDDTIVTLFLSILDQAEADGSTLAAAPTILDQEDAEAA